jgi:hypothetical protein
VAAHPMCYGEGTRLGDDQNAGEKKKTSVVTAAWLGLVSSLSVKLRRFGSGNLAEGNRGLPCAAPDARRRA